jgi:hypothetical protein
MNDILVVISNFNQVDIATDHSPPYLGSNSTMPVARGAAIALNSIFVGVWRKECFHHYGCPGASLLYAASVLCIL